MIGHRAPGERFAEAARCLIGTSFRLHGRDPATGIDCVGLVCCSLSAIGVDALAPAGYRLRNVDPSRWLHFAGAAGFEPATGEFCTGDLLLTRPGPGQQHLVVVDSAGTIIHAHAGLGQVVRQSAHFPTPPQAHWRLNESTK